MQSVTQFAFIGSGAVVSSAIGIKGAEKVALSWTANSHQLYVQGSWDQSSINFARIPYPTVPTSAWTTGVTSGPGAANLTQFADGFNYIRFENPGANTNPVSLALTTKF